MVSASKLNAILSMGYQLRFGERWIGVTHFYEGEGGSPPKATSRPSLSKL